MPQYIEFNNEVIEFPDGMSDAEIESVLSGSSQQAEEQPTQPEQSDFAKEAMKRITFQPYDPDPVIGFVKGAITDLPVGLAQLGANIFGSEETAAKANQLVNQYEDLGGSTVNRLLGGFVNPLNRFFPQGGKTLKATAAKSAAGGAAAGLLTPTEVSEGGDYFNNKQVQAGIGAVLGGGIPLATVGLGKMAGWLGENVNLSKNAKTNAIREYLNTLAGKEKEEVINRLANAGELVTGSKPTAAQAIGDLPSASGLLAEQRRVARTTSDFNVRASEQEAARQAAVESIASPRGITQQQVAQARNQQTGQLREDALQQANANTDELVRLTDELQQAVGAPRQVGDTATEASGMIGALQAQGAAQTEAAQAINRANNWTPVPGMPRFPGRYSPNMDRAIEQNQVAKEAGDLVAAKKAEVALKSEQLRSLNEEGFFPLRAESITKEVRDLVSAPGIRAKEGVADAVKDVAARIEEFTNSRGFIDSNDLYAIRQTINSSLVNSYGSRGKTPDTALLRKMQKQVENLIDSSITKASGTTLWGDYLKKYSKYSNKLNRMKIGDNLLSYLKGDGAGLGKEQAGKFAEAVFDSKALIEKSTGNKMYTQLSDVMSKGEINKLQSVVADLKRTATAERLGSKIETPTFDKGSVTLPGLIDSRIAIANSVLGYAKRGDMKAMDTLVADLMLNPKKLAAFMAEPDKGKMDLMLKAIGTTASSQAAKNFVTTISRVAAQQTP